MENREDFKRVVEGINQLEQQLLSIVEDGKVNDKDFAEAEEEVERYFSRCEQALAARKEGLLRELAQKLTDQSMSSSILLPSPLLCLPSTQKGKAVMDAQEEVNMAIKARKKMLKAGSYVYKIDIKSAEHAWEVWWSSSLLSHIALSLLLLHDFFLSLSFLQPPSHSPHSELIFLNAGSHQSAMASSLSGKDEVGPLQLILWSHWSTWHRYVTSLYILKNGHKGLTLFHHHLSCVAAGWQARSSTWEGIGSWCLSAPLQGKDSNSRGPSSGDRVQIFDCKWVTKTR